MNLIEFIILTTHSWVFSNASKLDSRGVAKTIEQYFDIPKQKAIVSSKKKTMKKPSVIRTEVFDRLKCLFYEDLRTMMLPLSSVILTGELFHRQAPRVSEISGEIDLERLWKFHL